MLRPSTHFLAPGHPRGHDHLAEWGARTDFGQRVGHSVEPDGVVDVDAQPTHSTQVGQRLEVGRARLDCQHPEPAPGGEPGHRADREHAQHRPHGPSHTQIPATRGERSPTGGHRSVGHEVQDEVVRLAADGEVLGPVVDHLVGTQRPHELELAAVVDTGDMGTPALGQLDGEGARPPSPAVDQNPSPLRSPDRALQCDRAGLRDGRRLREGELGWLAGQCRLRGDRELRKAALELEIVPVDLVAGLEAGHAGAHGLDPAGDVGAERRTPRRPQPTQARVEGRATQTLPVTEVDRRRRDPDQHLRGRG